MAPFKFLSLTSASLFLLQSTYTRAAGQNGAGQDGAAQDGFTPIDCLSSINEARSLVGFAPFKATASGSTALKTFLTNNTNSNKTKLCEAVKSTGGGTVLDTGDTSSGIAYTGQTGAQGDCAAAVTSFKEGFAALGSQKPGKYQKNAPPFNVGSAVSFASIFYPKDGEVECAYVTCEASSQAGDGGSNASGGTAKAAAESSPTGGEAAGGDAAATKNALFCLTKPPTLVDGKEPYTDDEFKALQKLSGSGVNSMPTFLGLVAAAAGLILL